MEDNKPKRGILKSKNNYTLADNKIKKTVRWDESNIKKTSRPYSRDSDIRYKEPSVYGIADDSSNEDNNKLNTEISTLDPESFEVKQKTLCTRNSDENLRDSVATKAFELKRKLHYNEYFGVKLLKIFSMMKRKN
ncbi:protein phosphatase inhibitor 2-like [Centruroides sculpturatus]|uniref:protein phosphatase inhibitor 2-like n=1 Tax=Centruroides sculpturatus TaxID=218467 RepID=UPI000C6D11B2|nr:protein phosphatase inhibitor 2-like [Centruroides sculpturatus]